MQELRLGGLTLCVGEVCGNCNNSLCNLLAEICFCVRLELLKDHCGNLLRSVLLVVDRNLVVRTHLTLD